MALVKYGGGIIQMSGSIAGNTFARNRYGNYVRAKTKPVNPNTTKQVKIRAAIAQLTEEWYDTLTAVQRAAWNTYAAAVAMKNKLGETVHLSGFNHFIRSNSIRLYTDLAITAPGPAILTLPNQDPAFAITASEATQVISAAWNDGLDWVDEDDAWMHVFQGISQNPTRNFFNGPWNIAESTEGDAAVPPTTPTAIAAVFPFLEGQKIWCYARIARADGRLSEKFATSCIAAA